MEPRTSISMAQCKTAVTPVHQKRSNEVTSNIVLHKVIFICTYVNQSKSNLIRSISLLVALFCKLWIWILIFRCDFRSASHDIPCHPQIIFHHRLSCRIYEVMPVVNSLWLSDAIWCHRSVSTLAQVMACCLTAPSHYQNHHVSVMITHITGLGSGWSPVGWQAITWTIDLLWTGLLGITLLTENKIIILM